MPMSLRIGIVVGEASGDILGEALVEAIRAYYPDAEFEGIVGPRMKALGCSSLFDAERLAVMGFIEPLKRLPELFSMRSKLIQHFAHNPPDMFIGIDAPDFNLTIEKKLKALGIKTVHYVSPSVWAWRRYRVKKISRAVDLMLTLFPFEEAFYRQHQVPVKFIGHTLADEIPMEPDSLCARKELGLGRNGPIVGLLPGSRAGEVSLLAEPFFEVAKWCLSQDDRLHFVVPLISEKTYEIAAEQLKASGLDASRVTLFLGQSRRVMAASDVLLIASGTATLEALLLKRPMVVAYKLSPLTYFLAGLLVKLPYYSLPNLLAERAMVREYIQDEMVVPDMGAALLSLLNDETAAAELKREYANIHRHLKCDASKQAARAIFDLLGLDCSGSG